jgi:ferritin
MAIANFLVKVSLENLVIDYTAFCDAVMVTLEKIVSPGDFDFAQFKEVFEAATKSRDEAQAKLNEVVEEVAKKLRAATPASLDGSQLSLNLPDAVQETEQTPGE